MNTKFKKPFIPTNVVHCLQMECLTDSIILLKYLLNRIETNSKCIYDSTNVMHRDFLASELNFNDKRIRCAFKILESLPKC